MRGWLAGLLILGATGVASAYVPTRTAEGSAVHWPMSCIVIAPDARGDTSASEIDLDTVATTLSRAVANWNSRIRDCSYIKIGVAPATRALEPVSDGRPSVVFRSERWGRGSIDYSPQAIGRTTVWFNSNKTSPTDGLISDADIELNAVNFTFSTHVATATAVPNTTLADLENTLTHELGHLLGLAHTCIASYDESKDPPLDNLGQPVPACPLGANSAALPETVRNATMYPYSDPGATNLRVPSDDDVKGVCDAYPITSAPTACYGFIEGAGCAFGGDRPALGGGILLCLLALVAARRRARHAML